MVTEYFVLWADSTETLQNNVNEAIKNGWQPLGGVAVSVRWLSGGYRPVVEYGRYFQAVGRVAPNDHESRRDQL